MSQTMPFLADESRQLLNQLREPIQLGETILTHNVVLIATTQKFMIRLPFTRNESIVSRLGSITIAIFAGTLGSVSSLPPQV